MARTTKAVKELLTQLGAKRAEALVVSELLQSLMSVWGGSQQFAAAYHTEFVKAKEGGVVRARMLDSVIRLFQVHTANLKGSEVNVGTLSEEELRAAVQELIGGAHE